MLRRPRLRSVVLATVGVGVTFALAVAALNLYVVLSSDGRASADVNALPHAQAAIVLGAGVQPNGFMSGMLVDRVKRAVDLYHAGKVDKVIVSGDHHTWTYDEPGTMKRALLKAGVPASAIFTDHAGFDTWATMVRARRVFGVHSAIVITQGFHMGRALYLAQAAGLDAHGLTSDLRGYGRQGQISDVREVLARVKAVAETVTNRPVLLGPEHPITADGRTTWGPVGPPAWREPRT